MKNKNFVLTLNEFNKLNELNELNEEKERKQRFILYTNPNNVTNAAYVRRGPDVTQILKKGREYPGSHRTLYQGRGTTEDIKEIINKYFSDYNFTNI